MKKRLVDGTIYNINFVGSIGGEINDQHLAVIYTIPKIENVVLAIPLTSPKLKHFKTSNDFNNRNYKELKYASFYYIKQSDSIVLLEQFKTISPNRVLKPYKDVNGNPLTLSWVEINKLNEKLLKYVTKILYKTK